MTDVVSIAKNARVAAQALAALSTEEKNKILNAMADNLDKNREAILGKNAIDVENGKKNDLSESLIDRLVLNNERLDGMIKAIRDIAALEDYVGRVESEKTLDNGLQLVEKRVGFGVVAVIYESRPNVTSDVCAICLKSSSVVILKGGKEAVESNTIIAKLLQDACPIENCFQLITSSDRELIKDLIALDQYIDLVIPRGSERLIQFVRQNAKVPSIETGTGNCHVFVDEGYDTDNAVDIIVNAKTQRPSVCNAIEHVIVHESVAEELLPKLKEQLDAKNVEIRGDEAVQKIIDCKAATDDDWGTEYLDLVLGIKIVKNVDEAIDHINTYGSRHSESILTNNQYHKNKFFTKIDAAAVYHNASTRFTDGAEFGLGCEIGISTQKMHARGPMGLKALTTTKWLVEGNGQIRE